ncbi:hypothetical protein GCM10025867_49470 (plasmid) [Frondihabitans sucicola]|uniref:Uncharacterized protein n=1 Tax=Frondihabitans sucicola TaxID=1268041 RepID=A0ABM8GW50_9MICO|nr:hypothetical protein [Frondihabitans sucicola]BDZ52706.1 hypothetical protein GCM10025867_49470 [Frondihabitans sucicola]
MLSPTLYSASYMPPLLHASRLRRIEPAEVAALTPGSVFAVTDGLEWRYSFRSLRQPLERWSATVITESFDEAFMREVHGIDYGGAAPVTRLTVMRPYGTLMTLSLDPASLRRLLGPGTSLSAGTTVFLQNPIGGEQSYHVATLLDPAHGWFASADDSEGGIDHDRAGEWALDDMLSRSGIDVMNDDESGVRPNIAVYALPFSVTQASPSIDDLIAAC